jgi:hypothetical protein
MSRENIIIRDTGKLDAGGGGGTSFGEVKVGLELVLDTSRHDVLDILERLFGREIADCSKLAGLPILEPLSF